MTPAVPLRARSRWAASAAAAATATVAVTVAATVAQYGPASMGINGVPRRVTPRSAGVGRGDHIALTFDDGPHADGTPAVLQVLARHRVHATFFLIADRAAEHADLVRLLVDAGHEVALHGWDHRPLPLRSPLRTGPDLAAAAQLVHSLARRPLRWYRPPYGVATGAALLAALHLGLQPVWWTAWGRDWSARASGDSVATCVLRSLRPGGTVLLHDSDRFAAAESWRRTVAALPAIIRACLDRGCTVGPLREHW